MWSASAREAAAIARGAGRFRLNEAKKKMPFGRGGEMGGRKLAANEGKKLKAGGTAMKMGKAKKPMLEEKAYTSMMPGSPRRKEKSYTSMRGRKNEGGLKKY